MILIALAAGSAWLLDRLAQNNNARKTDSEYFPDYYMENFITSTTDEDGTLKNKLYGDYMAHYPDNDTSRLTNPVLEIFRESGMPLMIRADKGWVTSNNEIILLEGDVRFWQDDEDGNRSMEVITTEARVLPEQDYAETDQPATLIGKKTTTRATGARAYLKESKIELLSNVHTIIQPDTSE